MTAEPLTPLERLILLSLRLHSNLSLNRLRETTEVKTPHYLSRTLRLAGMVTASLDTDGVEVWTVSRGTLRSSSGTA